MKIRKNGNIYFDPSELDTIYRFYEEIGNKIVLNKNEKEVDSSKLDLGAWFYKLLEDNNVPFGESDLNPKNFKAANFFNTGSEK